MSGSTETSEARIPPEGFSPFPFGLGFADHIGPIYAKFDPDNPEGRPLALGFFVEKHHCNPAGICHGGMMMTVMDMAIGMAVSRAAGSMMFTPSVNLTYDFIRPGKLGSWLESRVDFSHATRRTGFANGYLDGPEGPVMRANGICKIPSPDNKQFRRMDAHLGDG